MKIDLHTHIIPPDIPNYAKKFGYGDFIHLDHDPTTCTACMMKGPERFRVIESNCWDVEKRLEECNKDGVSVQVLSTIPVLFNYWAKPEHASETSKYINDHLAQVVSEHPTRFIALGTVPLQETQLACFEMERAVKKLGMPGIEIGSNVNGRNLDDPALDEFWATAQDLGASIFIHPWDMMARDRMSKYWTPWLVGMMAETALAYCSLTMGGVLDKYPDLKICFAHGGGSFPATIGRIDHGFNVRPDLCQTDSQSLPSSWLKKIYIDSLVHDEDALKLLIKKVGVQRIALGTDYPFPLGEHRPGALIEKMSHLTQDQRSWLNYKSALAFLGLDEKHYL
ncbi:MAG: 2-amino-3-carboxymuconate-6-semialdehyde decarboxylase [Myxococcales bacterium]|nr:2-amino-3-carboxymuconate-6-semialdehyde decarboxylase [Myxococcales bacterium]|tara:strand:- start:186 stop:1199 length:1014 start_codon:yes stop_codon:yes gene_type:complete